MTDISTQSKPKLTRLELHGFKSFATKTVFAFEPGITAIVGPNGSGKSNVSDAVRWVLGESSYSALRSKKTEDVIFAGGKGRAPAGMAEVTVTFDNEDHWLPSEFAEVTVTRRAFRGGESQYLINGRRVRLKDVALLTASLGHSYTVVGQGLVDAALSQRAEERRGLFEHAADLTGLRLKVQEAERNLAESDTNITRLTDLLTEVEPTLKRLERSARQAKEWQGLRERLVMLQRGHYRRLLIAAKERLVAAEALVADDESAMREVQDRLDALTAERAGLETARQEAAEALERHDARLAALREQHRRESHQRDLVAERQAALDRRREDMEDTQSGLNEQVSTVETALAEANTAWETTRDEVVAARKRVEELRAAADDARRARGDLEHQANELAQAIARNERKASDLEGRRALLAQRMQTSASDRARIDREREERAARIAGFEEELAAFTREDEHISGEMASLSGRLDELKASLAERQDAARQAAARLAELDRQHGQATNRLDVLQRLHESGSNLHAGVRQVMQWHREGTLSGIRGTLAELIDVGREYDTALEVALGGHLQDVVVERWADAEAAIRNLKTVKAGRATFQPIETVRQRGGNRPMPRELEGAPGVHGVAANLVTSEPGVDDVVRGLLGRIVVVDDLATSRRLMETLPGGWSTVTLSGEIARSGGSVTGGSAVRESGVLGRERELRELPSEIRRLQREREEARNAQESVATDLQAILDERNATESTRSGLAAQLRERSGQHQRLESWLRDLRKEQKATDQRTASAEISRANHEAEIAGLEADQASVQDQIASLQERHDALHTSLRESQDASTGDEDALAGASQHLAALEERLRAQDRQRSQLLSQRRGLSEEIELRTRRAAELDGERDALAGQLDRVTREVGRLGSALDAASTERRPLLDAVEGVEARIRELSGKIDAARQEMLERQRGLGERGLIVERARSETAGVHQRIIDDLDYEEPVDLIQDTEGNDFPGLDDDHEAVEKEIGRLRNRLHRVGYVSEDIVEEYEREAERFEFMTTQLADVEAAAASLREMIADLHRTMQERFEETFAQVAEAFTEAFTALFGGGTARLVLTSDEEGAPGGIDIVAQPPGKRLQGLSLLSGGERSLTAVALLFAILRVNPSPFVLLDEVDAALDEANVVRFRDELRTLADETQAIVITHNRGTVEIADTLYGVTMGGDGVSQVLSLRLSDIPLDEDVDVRDIPAVTAGIPVR
jgi:chromosome segregation protein